MSLVKQRLRVGDELAQPVAPATLSPIQAQILNRLALKRPDVYLHPSITPTVAFRKGPRVWTLRTSTLRSMRVTL